MNTIKTVLKENGIEIEVNVLPRSSRNQIAGVHNGAVKIKLTSAPVQGKANEQCCGFIADCLGISRSRVEIKRGFTSRTKTVFLSGISLEDVKHHMLKHLH